MGNTNRGLRALLDNLVQTLFIVSVFVFTTTATAMVFSPNMELAFYFLIVVGTSIMIIKKVEKE